MRVEIIEETTSYDLEYAINRRLSEYESSDILAIKYIGSNNCSDPSNEQYSAMIIFK